MKCYECPCYWTTATTGYGVCSVPDSFFPTTQETDCIFLKEKKPFCKDCSHFGNDTACMTATAEDPADDCPGFISLNKEACMEYIFDEIKTGKPLDKVLAEIKTEMEATKAYKFIEEYYKNNPVKNED